MIGFVPQEGTPFGVESPPFLSALGLPNWVWGFANITCFFAKVAAFLLFFIWVRWTLPRFRFDQLMKIGWLYLFEIALANIFLTAAVGALSARAQGIDVKLFGTYYNQVGSNVVITKEWAEKNKITTATPYKDRLPAMKGITIGITGPGVTDQVARYMGLEAGGGASSADVKGLPGVNAASLVSAQGLAGIIAGWSTPRSAFTLAKWSRTMVFGSASRRSAKSSMSAPCG